MKRNTLLILWTCIGLMFGFSAGAWIGMLRGERIGMAKVEKIFIENQKRSYFSVEIRNNSDKDTIFFMPKWNQTLEGAFYITPGSSLQYLPNDSLHPQSIYLVHEVSPRKAER